MNIWSHTVIQHQRKITISRKNRKTKPNLQLGTRIRIGKNGQKCSLVVTYESTFGLIGNDGTKYLHVTKEISNTDNEAWWRQRSCVSLMFSERIRTTVLLQINSKFHGNAFVCTNKHANRLYSTFVAFELPVTGLQPHWAFIIERSWCFIGKTHAQEQRQIRRHLRKKWTKKSAVLLWRTPLFFFVRPSLKQKAHYIVQTSRFWKFSEFWERCLKIVRFF